MHFNFELGKQTTGVLGGCDTAARGKPLAGGKRKSKNDSVQKYFAGKANFKALNQSNRAVEYLCVIHAYNIASAAAPMPPHANANYAPAFSKLAKWALLTKISARWHVRQWHRPMGRSIQQADHGPCRETIAILPLRYAQRYPSRLGRGSVDHLRRGSPAWAQ